MDGNSNATRRTLIWCTAAIVIAVISSAVVVVGYFAYQSSHDAASVKLSEHKTRLDSAESAGTFALQHAIDKGEQFYVDGEIDHLVDEYREYQQARIAYEESRGHDPRPLLESDIAAYRAKWQKRVEELRAATKPS